MDSRSRTLVREAQARDGDPVADALVLADRLRRGDLARDRLGVAAACGSEAARLALGTEATYSPVDYPTLLDRLPAVTLLPALIAAAEAALPHVGLGQEAATAAACVLEAARAFSVAPSDAARARWEGSSGDWCREDGPTGWLPVQWTAQGAFFPNAMRARLARCHNLAGDVVRPAVERALLTWALA